MEITIVHEENGYTAYVDGKFYGKYDSPVQAAQAIEESDLEDDRHGRND